MKRLNLLYDHQVFSLQQYGGVSRIFYELIKQLCKIEEINLFLFQGLHINRFPLVELKDRIALYRGKKVRYFSHIAPLLKIVNRILFTGFSLKKVIDLYHPTNYASFVYNWMKSPVVLTVNDMIPELFPHHFRDIQSRLRVKKRCIQRADFIITISQRTRQDLLNYYPVAADKVRVIYPGAPVSPAKVEDIPPFSHARPFVLYVGTRKQGYKNFKGFYSSFASSPKLSQHFDLICFGGGHFKKRELQRLGSNGQKVRIFHPPRDENLLPALYRGASALVYPSLYEGFGLPPLEAMTYGCPVLAANTPPMPEILGDAPAYFEPADGESMVSAMETVLFDEELKQEMIKKGTQQVKQYSWQKMAAETYQVYRELAG